MPRNAPLESTDEIRAVRGFGEIERLLPLLGIDADGILWSRAPDPVLVTLPGMSPAALEVLRDRRDVVTHLPGLADFPELPEADRRLLVENAAALLPRVTDVPENWRMRISASVGRPAISVAIHLAVQLAAGHVTISTWTVMP